MAKKNKDKSKDDPEKENDAPPEGEAPAEEGGGDAAEGGKTGLLGNKKLLIIIGTAILLLVGGGAALYFTGMLDGLLGKSGEEEAEAAPAEHGKKGESEKVKGGKDSKHKEGKAKEGHGKSEEGKAGEGGEAGEVGGEFLAIPPMIINLNSDDGTPRYLRLTVQLELKNEDDRHAIQAILPRVIDQFQTYTRELRVKDLQGSAGIYRLQMELLWRVNQAAAPVEVKDVLFQEILIQ